MAPIATERPAVSVVLPFLGGAAEARDAIGALAAIERRADDEVIVVDNSGPGSALVLDGTAGVRVVAATVKRSAYAARNEGAELARCDWLLFLDADCRPRPTILDDYFGKAIDEACGAVGGEVVGVPGQPGLAARYGRARRLLSLANNRSHPYLPIAPTANVLVRRSTWAALGGFPEGLSAAADVWFCWRLQESGWSLSYRGEAVVEHLHRGTLRALVRQVARNEAGAAWLNRRRPGILPRPSLAVGLRGALGGAALFTVRGQLERALMKLLDALVVATQAGGSLMGNSAADHASGDRDAVVVVAEVFPQEGSRSLERLRELATTCPLRVEAATRADDAQWRPVRGIEALFWEDEGATRTLLGVAWTCARHPLRSAADHRARRTDQVRVGLRDIAPAARRLARTRGAGPLVLERGPAEALAARLCRLSGTAQSTNVL